MSYNFLPFFGNHSRFPDTMVGLDPVGDAEDGTQLGQGPRDIRNIGIQR